MDSVPSEVWFRSEDSESGFKADSGSGSDSDWIEFLIFGVFGFFGADSGTGTDGSGDVETFSKHNQAVNVIASNVWMVIDELAELRFKTTTEEVHGILVIEIIEVAMVPLEQ
ncbi:hypothetical protein BGZ93_003224, partial [Podila epicladia]